MPSSRNDPSGGNPVATALAAMRRRLSLLQKSLSASSAGPSDAAASVADGQESLRSMNTDALVATISAPSIAGQSDASASTSSPLTSPGALGLEAYVWSSASSLVLQPTSPATMPPQTALPARRKRYTARRERTTGYIRWTADDGSEEFLSPSLGPEAAGQYMRKRMGLPVSPQYDDTLL